MRDEGRNASYNNTVMLQILRIEDSIQESVESSIDSFNILYRKSRDTKYFEFNS